MGKHARFGRGEQTLTGLDIRDTWEIPRHLVRADWDERVLADVLMADLAPRSVEDGLTTGL